jgi:predicted phosphate transport protein (TIGR00153 family)
LFKSGHISVWLSRKKEREILGECKLHADAIVATVAEMKKVVYSFCEDDLEGVKRNFEMVFKQERDADNLKREILDKLSTGPFHPITREEVIRVVLTADDVAANAKSAARKISASSSRILPDEIKDGLRGLADMDVRIAEKMREAFIKLLEDPRAAIEVTNEVERMEEEIDDFRVSLVEKILKFGDTAKSISAWLMLKEAVENMEDVADRSEDVADVIRSIAILS